MSDHSIVLENIELSFLTQGGPQIRFPLGTTADEKDATIEPFVALKDVNIKVKREKS